MMQFKKFRRLHFVGIGGTGMSGIAELLLRWGYTVTGSDLKLSDVTRRLQGLGAAIVEGHSPGNVEGAHVVVISSAVSPDNPEVKAALANHIPVIKRSEMLAELMRMKYGIAVSGTHGKSTVTSFVGSVLEAAGLDPTIIVGGRLKHLGSGARSGGGEFLVAEADEFDRSFLKLMPVIAVITNLELEHMDCYSDLDDLKSAFWEFASKVPFYGRAVLCLDDPNLQAMMPDIGRPMFTYGTLPHADVRAVEIVAERAGSAFDLVHGGRGLGGFRLNVPGRHNVMNCLAAIAVALELDIDVDVIRSAVESFSGVSRRFELIGKFRGADVIDDYAHHPTEVEATLRAALNDKTGKVVAVLQPHLYSRTRMFCREFGKALILSDELVVTGIYGSREEPIDGVSAELIVDAARSFGHRRVHYVPDKNDIPSFLRDIVREGDIVVFMGAGDITSIAHSLVEAAE